MGWSWMFSSLRIGQNDRPFRTRMCLPLAASSPCKQQASRQLILFQRPLLWRVSGRLFPPGVLRSRRGYVHGVFPGFFPADSRALSFLLRVQLLPYFARLTEDFFAIFGVINLSAREFFFAVSGIGSTPSLTTLFSVTPRPVAFGCPAFFWGHGFPSIVATFLRPCMASGSEVEMTNPGNGLLFTAFASQWYRCAFIRECRSIPADAIS